jgi:hypothetical protein
MENVATTPVVRGAWVGQCPKCGTCCYFSKYPATGYAGQQVVRLGRFNPASVPCSCSRRFQVDGDDLLFVTVSSLSVERASPDSFKVEQNHAGNKVDMGTMSETELWGYLDSRTLIDIIPSQVLAFLNVVNALDMDMVLAVVRPAVRAAQAAVA